MIKIVIAEDHEVYVEGVKSLLAGVEDILICGIAGNGKELLELLGKSSIDVALVDIAMPEMNGLEATKIIKEKFPETKVIILTFDGTRDKINAAIEAGAMGYLLKNSSKSEIPNAIREVAGGNKFHSPKVTEVVMSNPSNKKEIASGVDNISEREKEVICLIAQGFKSKEIAEKLFIALYTVETHRKNILSKLELTNSAGLTKWAIENNICPK